MTDQKPIEKLVNAILLSAIHKTASHVRVAPAPLPGIAEPGVYFFVDSAWHQEMAPPAELYLPMVRRLGVMLGVLPPKKGEPWFGRLCMQLGEDRFHYFLVAIDRRDSVAGTGRRDSVAGTGRRDSVAGTGRRDVLHALVEVVDEATYLTKRQPRPPSPHPYRHG